MTALITIFGFVFAFFAILQAVLSPTKIYGIYEVAFAKPFGSFVNRHNFAAYIEMTIAVPLGLLFAGAVQKDKRLLYVTAIGLMGVALILSGSRGGLVALLAEIVFLVILTNKTKGASKFVIKDRAGRFAGRDDRRRRDFDRRRIFADAICRNRRFERYYDQSHAYLERHDSRSLKIICRSARASALLPPLIRLTIR